MLHLIYAELRLELISAYMGMRWPNRTAVWFSMFM